VTILFVAAVACHYPFVCVCVCMCAEDHDVHGCKSTVFTVSKFDIVSSDMERIVVNQFSNLEASHRKARSSSMSTLLFFFV
jgi:hypothetical protein